MSIPATIQIRGKGNITLPIEIRRKYGFNDGDVVSIIDLGEGSILIVPKILEVNRLADRIERIMDREEVSLDELLTALDEERERYYQEQYAKDQSFPG